MGGYQIQDHPDLKEIPRPGVDLGGRGLSGISYTCQSLGNRRETVKVVFILTTVLFGISKEILGGKVREGYR